MKRVFILCLTLVLGCAAVVSAATEVKMTGDVRISAMFLNQYPNFTGWSPKGDKTVDSFTINERFRLRTDFVANENLKFRLGIRVNNKFWGADAYTVDNPAVSIDVYRAYLQFKWPNTNVEFTVGLAPVDLPVSDAMFYGNPVLGNTQMAQASVNIPVSDQFKVIAGFGRLLDTNTQYDPTTRQVADEVDAYFLALPITLEGFKASPWAMLAVVGKNNTQLTSTSFGASPRYKNQGSMYFASELLSPAAAFTGANGISNAQNPYFWVGTSLAVTAADPVKFFGDIVYGCGMMGDKTRNNRSGWFFDLGVQYTGLDAVTPQLAFWYSSGEQNNINKASTRMPTITQYWGPNNSFMFDSGFAFSSGSLQVNPIGSWGLSASLDKITFMKGLKHRLTFSFAQGTNAPKSLRQGVAAMGNGAYYQMGRDLANNEQLYAINFDNQYNIYENLAAIVETGWAHGNFQKNIWGRRFVNQANNGDVWKVAFGLQYKF